MHNPMYSDKQKKKKADSASSPTQRQIFLSILNIFLVPDPS